MFPIVIPFHQKKPDEQDSMVQMPWEEVRTLAMNTLKTIKARREAKKREHILYELERANRSWWSRLWKQTYSYEQIEARELGRVDGGDSVSAILDNPLFWIDTYWERNEKAANRLVGAARFHKDIWVCTKDLDLMMDS